MRLSDADRERAVEALKGGYAEGRLDTGELEDRVERVYYARSRVEVAPHLIGLPLLGLRAVIGARLRRMQQAVLRAHLATWASLNACILCIWGLTGAGMFWPAWLLVPSTALLGWHAFASRSLSRALSRRGW